MPKLDIILPCYNPVEGWEKAIISAISEIQEKLVDVALYVLLVNDGSTEGISQAQTDLLNKQVPNLEYLEYTQNQGKGNALRHGMRQSKNDICIFTDVDFPYTTDSFVRLYKELSEGNAMVAVGTRDEQYYKQVPSMRVKISKVFKFFVRKFFSLPISDTQCGLKGMRGEGKAIFLQTTTNRYLFDLEFIHLFAKQSLGKLTAVPVELKPNIELSAMNWRILFSEGGSFLLIFFKHLFQKKGKVTSGEQ